MWHARNYTGRINQVSVGSALPLYRNTIIKPDRFLVFPGTRREKDKAPT